MNNSTVSRPSEESQTISTRVLQRLMFTKEYATKHILVSLVHPFCKYHKYLWALAEQDAKKDVGIGDKKQLVKFQLRLQEVAAFDDASRLKVVDRILRSSQAPLTTLLRSITICNCLIMGNLDALVTKKAKNRVKIPSEEEFIFGALQNIGRRLFGQPENMFHQDLLKEDVEDGILQTIYENFPFEEIIEPLVDNENFFVTDEDADDDEDDEDSPQSGNADDADRNDQRENRSSQQDFAKNLISKMDRMTPQEAEACVQRQIENLDGGSKSQPATHLDQDPAYEIVDDLPDEEKSVETHSARDLGFQETEPEMMDHAHQNAKDSVDKNQHQVSGHKHDRATSREEHFSEKPARMTKDDSYLHQIPPKRVRTKT